MDQGVKVKQKWDNRWIEQLDFIIRFYLFFLSWCPRNMICDWSTTYMAHLTCSHQPVTMCIPASGVAASTSVTTVVLCCVVCGAGSEAQQVVAAGGGDGGGLRGGADTLTVVLHSHRYGFRPGDTSATCRHCGQMRRMKVSFILLTIRDSHTETLRSNRSPPVIGFEDRQRDSRAEDMAATACCICT